MNLNMGNLHIDIISMICNKYDAKTHFKLFSHDSICFLHDLNMQYINQVFLNALLFPINRII